MKLVVLSESDCFMKCKLGEVSKGTYVIISVRDKGLGPIKSLRTFHNVVDVLDITFDDVTTGSNKMSKSDAETIVSFFKQYRSSVNTIVIHCFAGQSRSYAIAKALSKAVKGSTIENYKNVNENPLVYKLIEKSLAHRQ